MDPLRLEIGLKTDPVEYRYSYDWLFRLLAQEGVKHVQLGTFFEIYQLPDAWFQDLRRRAEDQGLSLSSVFTAHRELGGFFRDDGPGWVETARRNYERLIAIAGLLGAQAVGSNPGAVPRDRMGIKGRGILTYLHHMKDLMRMAKDHGVGWLTIEPMSCLAEPPTLPEEIQSMAGELRAYHRANARTTADVGYCVDIAHGYVDAQSQLRHDHQTLLEASLPHIRELHLKNTDSMYQATFGFSPTERTKGIIHIEPIRDLLLASARQLPVSDLIGYLEIGGPKMGRDYSDPALEEMLRVSLRYLKEVFQTPPGSRVAPPPDLPLLREESLAAEEKVLLAPSIMCADMCLLADDVRHLETVGADLLHFDLMDAHFVPNMPLGLELLAQLRARTSLPFDVHLMVENNDWFIQELARIGVQRICVHVEAVTHLDRTLNLIQAAGIQAGVALNPATSLAALDYVLANIDFVLLMTVNPGFAGQKLCRGAPGKVADCRRLLQARRRDIPIAVDGNVSFENIPAMVAAGADILVAGTSSLFDRSGTLQNNAQKMRAAAAVGLKQRPAREAPV